ncbi:MAG: EAL domain-containing protein, partial [Gammaproteobacteria bacterium]|nr:EAL domain-containing protein [Gammaproteobacteria bacterium]
MLINIATILVVAGLLLLVVGIMIARQYTLRAKLLTSFLFIVLLSLGLLAALDSYLMSENLEETTYKILDVAARQYADRIDQFNEFNLESIQSEARLPALVDFIKYRGAKPYHSQTIREILTALQSRQAKDIVSFAVLNKDGINMVDTVNASIGSDESEEIYFKEVLLKKSPYQSPVIFSRYEEPALFFSSPIEDITGKFLGVLRVKYNASVLNKLLSDSRGRVGRGAFAMLMDESYLRLIHGRRNDLQNTLAIKISAADLNVLEQNGRVPHNSKRLFAEQPELINKLENTRFNNTNLQIQLFGMGEDLYSLSIARLTTAPWKVIFAQPKEVLIEPVEEQTRATLLFASAIAFLVVFIVAGTTRILLKPIRQLTNVVKQIGEGNLKIKANVDTNDEIGGLADAFNEMTTNVRVLVNDLEKEIDDHKLTADSLRKLSQAIEQSPVSVMITDLDGNIEYVNPEFGRVTGYTSEEVIGKNPRILKSGHTPPSQFTNMWNSITTGQSWSGELYNKKKNGDLFWENVTVSPIKSSDGKNTHYLAIKEDISIRKEYEERLMYQASYDKLTDLPNRSLAFDRLRQALANAIRDRERLAVMYVDFDHFKNINDTLGHNAGDSFLISMAERLKGIVRDVDTVARLGGDEFMLILTSTHHKSGEIPLSEYRDQIQQKAAEILHKVAQPCVIEDMEFSVTASIGIAIFPEDGDDPHILLKNADTAMYRGKRKGRNTFEEFTPEMSDKIVKRVEIESKLRRAVEEEKFYITYQSLVNTRTMRLAGAEALIRWEDDELGHIAPEIFIPFAEESGVIVDIGRWVLDSVCRDVKGLRADQDSKDFYIAVNLSGRQFRGKGFARQVSDTLSKYKLHGSSLELEITERLLMKDVPEVITTLDQLKEMGIRLSIDDFGTGYSSLSYLKRFPFDVLKIDKMFVHDIGVDPDNAALCEAIISMAHSLGLSVVGEGVENEEQFEFLRLRGAEIVQGYYVSKPMRYDEFKQFVTVSDWIASTVG